jgi:hypothetical protein
MICLKEDHISSIHIRVSTLLSGQNFMPWVYGINLSKKRFLGGKRNIKKIITRLRELVEHSNFTGWKIFYALTNGVVPNWDSIVVEITYLLNDRHRSRDRKESQNLYFLQKPPSISIPSKGMKLCFLIWYFGLRGTQIWKIMCYQRVWE